jgi:O-antigen/teichoic acid export membrane protein
MGSGCPRERAAGVVPSRPPGRLYGALLLFGLTFFSGGMLAMLSARQLPVDGRGEMVFAQVVCGISPLAMTFGVPTLARRLLAAGTRCPGDFVSVSLILSAASGLLSYLCVAAYTAEPLGLASLSAGALGLVNAQVQFVRELIYGLDRVLLGASCDTAFYSFQLGFCALAFSLGSPDAGVCLLICGLSGLPVVVMGYRILITASGPPAARSTVQISRSLGMGFPIAVVLVFQAIIQRADRLVVGVVLGKEQLARYSVNSSLGEVIWIVGSVGAQIRFAGAAGGSYTRRSLRRDLFLLGLGSFGAFTLLAAFSGSLVDVVFGSGYSMGALERSLLIFGSGAYSLFLFLLGIGTALGHAKAMAPAIICGGMAVVGSVFVLAGQFSIAGASVAVLICYCSLSGWMVRSVLRRLQRE